MAAVISAQIAGARASVSCGTAVRITTDRQGTSSALDVTGGSANAELGFPVGAVSGTGNVADIDAVTVAEVKTVIEAAIADVTVSADAGVVDLAA